MGEHDDLPRNGEALQDPGQPVHPSRLHGLDRVVDHHETERALRQRGPRQEQAQGQAVQLALTHHAQGGAPDPVHGHVEPQASPVGGALELDGAQLDAALLAQHVPQRLGLAGDGGEPLVSNDPRRPLEPLLTGLDLLDALRISAGGASRLHPGSHIASHRPPRVLPTLQLAPGGRTDVHHRRSQLLHPLQPVGQHVGARGAGALRQSLPPLSHVGGRDSHVGRPAEDVGRRAEQAPARLRGVVQASVGGLGVARLLVQLGRLRLGPGAPLPAQGVRLPAHTGQSPSPWWAWSWRACSRMRATPRARPTSVLISDATSAAAVRTSPASSRARPGSGTCTAHSRRRIATSPSVPAASALPASTSSTVSRSHFRPESAEWQRRARSSVDAANVSSSGARLALTSLAAPLPRQAFGT